MWLNAIPKKAILNDINHYIIDLFQQLQSNKFDFLGFKELLLSAKQKFIKKGTEYYNEIKDDFNNQNNTLFNFLLLCLTSWQRKIELNEIGKWSNGFYYDTEHTILNVNDPEGIYIYDLIRRLKKVQELIHKTDCIFRCEDFRKILQESKENDFVYADPPYINRSIPYGKKFDEKEMLDLINWSKITQSGYGISNWLKDKERDNEYISKFDTSKIIQIDHSYSIGYMKDNAEQNNKVIECLILSPKNMIPKQNTLNKYF